jgi:Haloacid dehalogenase-like hydrolase
MVITNGHSQVQRAKLERCKVASLFDHVLVGGDEVAAGGHQKPHPHIFLKACSLCNCLPCEVPPFPFPTSPGRDAHVFLKACSLCNCLQCEVPPFPFPTPPAPGAPGFLRGLPPLYLFRGGTASRFLYHLSVCVTSRVPLCLSIFTGVRRSQR